MQNIINNQSSLDVQAFVGLNPGKASPNTNTITDLGQLIGLPKSARITTSLGSKPKQQSFSLKDVVSSASPKMMGMNNSQFNQTLSTLGLTSENFKQQASSAFKALGTTASHALVKQILSENGMTPESFIKDMAASPEGRQLLNQFAGTNPTAGAAASQAEYVNNLVNNFSSGVNVIDLILQMSQDSNKMDFQATGIQLNQVTIVQHNMQNTVEGMNQNISKVKSEQAEQKSEPIWKKILKIVVPIAIMVVGTALLGPAADLLAGAIDLGVAFFDGSAAVADAASLADDAATAAKDAAKIAKDAAKSAEDATTVDGATKSAKGAEKASKDAAKAADKAQKASEDAKQAAESAKGTDGETDANDKADKAEKSAKEASDAAADAQTSANEAQESVKKQQKAAEEAKSIKGKTKLDKLVESIGDKAGGLQDFVSDKLDSAKEYLKGTDTGQSFIERGKQGKNYATKGLNAVLDKTPKMVKTLAKGGLIVGGTVGMLSAEQFNPINNSAEITELQSESSLLTNAQNAEQMSLKVNTDLVNKLNQDEEGNMSLSNAAVTASGTMYTFRV